MKRAVTVVAVVAAALAGCAPPAEEAGPIPDLTVVANSLAADMTPAQREIYTSHTYDQLRREYPEIYETLMLNHKERLGPWMYAVERSLTAGDREDIRRSAAPIAEANERLGRYYLERGLPYRQHVYFYVPGRYMQTLGGLSRFLHPENTIFIRIPARIPFVVHEEIHANSEGFHGRVLNEGMTELIAQRIFPTREPQTPQGDVLEQIVRAIAQKAGISEVEAFETLAMAFHTGDLSEVTRVLGANAWDAIVARTLACESCSMVATPEALDAFTRLGDEVRVILADGGDPALR